MKVLAIGATGFIGRHVVEHLLDARHDVAVLHRGETHPGLPGPVEHVLCDRDRAADLRAAVSRWEAEVVLDMVLYTERQAEDLVKALRGHAGRVVVVSSGDVYRNYDGFRGKATATPDAGPLDETAPLRETRYPYRGQGLSFAQAEEYDKILVEQVVLGQHDTKATVLRLPAVYGHGDPRFRLRPYLQRMDDGRPVILLGEEQSRWRWTRQDVGNVAAAIALAVTQARAERIYNLGGPETPTEREWVEQIGVAAGWRGRVVTLPAHRLPAHLQQPVDWRYDLHLSTARLRQELGYTEPFASHEVWERALEWERFDLKGDRLDYKAEDAALDTMPGDGV